MTEIETPKPHMATLMSLNYDTCTKDLEDRFLTSLSQKKDEIYKETNDCFTKAWLVNDDIESIAAT